MTRRQPNRRGYALMLVIVFVVLFSAILGVAWRRVASALRVEHLSEVRKQCDSGSVQVLASAMKLLETSLRRAANGNVALNCSTDSPQSYGKTADDKCYVIKFTRTSGFNPPSGPVDWSVDVTIVSAEEYSSLSLPALPENPP